MEDAADVTVECAPSPSLNSNINRIVICTNCVQMKRQLDDSLLRVKSLLKIIELLHQSNGDLRVLNQEDTADECVTVNEDFAVSCDNEHHGNSSAPLMTSALPSGLPVYGCMFKFIAQADSSRKCSDVVAYKKRSDYKPVNKGKSAALYSIPVIISG
jgi:hypothetical protein